MLRRGKIRRKSENSVVILMLLLTLTLAFSVNISLAEEGQDDKKGVEAFEYDDHGRRDPFWALVNSNGIIVNYEKEVLLSDLNLEGIIAGAAGRSMAIINGRVLQPGDKIGDFHVREIIENVVILYKGQQRFELKLKKEE